MIRLGRVWLGSIGLGYSPPEIWGEGGGVCSNTGESVQITWHSSTRGTKRERELSLNTKNINTSMPTVSPVLQCYSYDGGLSGRTPGTNGLSRLSNKQTNRHGEQPYISRGEKGRGRGEGRVGAKET